MSTLEVFAGAMLPFAGRTGLSFLEHASRALVGTLGARLCLVVDCSSENVVRPVVAFADGAFIETLGPVADLAALENACRGLLASPSGLALDWHVATAPGTAVCVLAAGLLDETAQLALSFIAARAPAEVARMKSESRARLESRLGLLREATGDLVWHWHIPTGHVEWIDATLQEGTMTFDAWRGRVHRGDLDRVEAALGELREGELDRWEDTYRYVHTDGTTRIEQIRAALERGQDGRPIRVIASSHDVTEARIHEQRLVLAERMAAMGTLAAGVAHEINNPLAYVMGNIEHVLEELGDARGIEPDLVAALGEAREGAERVRRIVEDLRVFARPRDEAVVQVDVDRVVESALVFVRADLERRARLEKVLGKPPLVEGNETQLGHVVLALLTNAVYALPEGAPEANVVAVETGVDESGRIFVSVRDSGAGISAENIGRIFDPFFTTKRVGDGTGLGLSIAHAIIMSVGGEISVDSAPGTGSTFRVTFPAHRGA